MRYLPLLTSLSALALSGPAAAQDDGRAAVHRAALDYIEGFYEGDSTKLVRSVAPEVLKFGFHQRDDGAWRRIPFPWTSFLGLARAVREGRQSFPPNARKDVTIYDVQERIAAVRVDADWGMDYLLIARTDEGRWMVTHVLWQGPPGVNRP